MKTFSPTQCLQCPSRVTNIFCTLDRSTTDLISQRKTSREYRKKQVIFYESSPVTGVYCIQSGKVKVYKTGPEGKQHILFIGGPGDILGLESLFTGDQIPEAAEMIEDGVVCLIPREVMLDVIRKNSEMAMKILKILADQLVASEEERVDLAQSSVRERMARLLTHLAEDHGVNGKSGVRITLPLSREEMADMVGTAAETAMRLLKEFKEDKLVEVHGREIVILNRQRLRETANLVQ